MLVPNLSSLIRMSLHVPYRKLRFTCSSDHNTSTSLSPPSYPRFYILWQCALSFIEVCLETRGFEIRVWSYEHHHRLARLPCKGSCFIVVIGSVDSFSFRPTFKLCLWFGWGSSSNKHSNMSVRLSVSCLHQPILRACGSNYFLCMVEFRAPARIRSWRFLCQMFGISRDIFKYGHVVDFWFKK